MAHSLSLPEWAVLGVLLLRDRQFGEMRLTNSQLEDATGLCENSLRKARKRLVERGLISFVVSRDGATYTLHTEGQDNGKQEAATENNSGIGKTTHSTKPKPSRPTSAREGVDSKNEQPSQQDTRAIIAHFKRAFPTAGIGQGSAGALLQAARGDRQAVIEAIDKAVAGNPKAPLPYVKAVLGRLMEEKSVVEPEPEPESHVTQLASVLSGVFKSNPVKWE